MDVTIDGDRSPGADAAPPPSLPEEGARSLDDRGRPADRARRRTFRWSAAGIGLAAALAGAYVFAPPGAWTRAVHLAGGTITALGIIILLAVAARAGRALSWPWACVSVAVLAQAGGDWLWSRQDWSRLGDAPPQSWAHLMYLFSRLAVGLALVILVRRRRRPDADRWIDVAAVGLITSLACWELAIRPVVDDPGVPLTTASVFAGYAAVDVILVVLLACVTVTHRRVTTSGTALVLGVMAWLTADIGLLAAMAHGGYAFGLTKSVDASSLAGLTLLAVAAAHPSRLLLSEPAAPLPPPSRSARIVLAVAVLVVPTGTAVLSAVAAGAHVYPSTPLATCGLAVLVAARLLRLDRARDQLEAQLRRNEDHFRALAANSADAVLVVDRGGRIANESAPLSALVGRSGASIVGSSVFAHVAAVDRETARASFARALRHPGQVQSLELRVDHMDGSVRWVGSRFVNLLHDPAVEAVVVNIHDVTARKKAEAAIECQAFHDPLTGLANRAMFRDRVSQALAAVERHAGPVPAVLFIDLDRFKGVNDTLGHEAGDELLQVVAARVGSAVRPADTVARLGGDEFAVLMTGSGTVEDEAARIAERVLGALSTPVSVAGRSVALGASIGLAVGGPGVTPSGLLSDADIAMYEAKSAGRGRWVRFDPGMRAVAVERLRLEDDLRGAVERAELQLAYQPIVDLASGGLRGFEALVRWDHPMLGRLGPDRFVPLAEETGAVIGIGRWVLQTACRTAATWQREFPRQPALTISVNISARQLLDDQLPADIGAALASSGLEPGALILEVAESALIDGDRDTMRRLGQLHELGVRLAVDDFGTGYSSFGHLRRYPVDILKVDRSLVSSMIGSDDLSAVLRSLLDLGRNLALEVVAEGIELDSQLATLRHQGALAGQGFLFAQPLSELDAEALLIDPSDAWQDQRSER